MNEPPEPISEERQIYPANEVGRAWSKFEMKPFRNKPDNPDQLGKYPARADHILVQHLMKDGNYEYGFIVKESATRWVVKTQSSGETKNIHVKKGQNTLYTVLDGENVIRIFIAPLAPRPRPEEGAYKEETSSEAEPSDSEYEVEETLARNQKIQAARNKIPLPVSDEEEEPQVPPEPSIDLPPPMGYVSDSGETHYPETDTDEREIMGEISESYMDESDWTNKMEERQASLRGHLEAIAEESDDESQELLGADPDWPEPPVGVPPARGKDSVKFDDERANWSASMIGVAFVFLMIANYMD